jgi:hypothetical protein
LLILGLIAAMDEASGIPNIDLKHDKLLRQRLPKARGQDGMLKAHKLSAMDLQQVQIVVEA